MKLIPLSKGYYAQVSDEDFKRVVAFGKWCASIEGYGTKVYAIRWITVDGKRVKIRMHRFICDLPPDPKREGPIVDHDDDDGLNNQRGNLVCMTQKENMDKVPNWCRKKETDSDEVEHVEW